MPAQAWICLVRHNALLPDRGLNNSGILVLGFFMNRAWEPLLGPTFLVVEWLLSAFGQEVVSQPANLYGHLAIRGCHLSRTRRVRRHRTHLGFRRKLLWFFRGHLRFPQTCILLPCGICVIWFANAVRIALLVLCGTYVSPQMALGGSILLPAGWASSSSRLAWLL